MDGLSSIRYDSVRRETARHTVISVIPQYCAMLRLVGFFMLIRASAIRDAVVFFTSPITFTDRDCIILLPAYVDIYTIIYQKILYVNKSGKIPKKLYRNL